MTTGLKVIEMRRALAEGILKDDSYAGLLPLNLSNTLNDRQENLKGSILKDYMQYHSKIGNLSSIAGSDSGMLTNLLDPTALVEIHYLDDVRETSSTKPIVLKSKVDIKKAVISLNSA